MKVFIETHLTPTTEQIVGEYVWLLARNLLQAKRNLRTITKNDPPIWALEFAKGVENEAHNRYYSAKEYFWDIIEKK